MSGNNANNLLADGISKTDSQTVAEALAAGADPNASLFSGATPLHIVAQLGPAESMNSMIEAGADVNARDSWKQTPLHHVPRSLSPDATAMIDALLKAGADVNAVSKWGTTPLDSAVAVNGRDDVQRIYDAGGDCATCESHECLEQILGHPPRPRLRRPGRGIG